MTRAAIETVTPSGENGCVGGPPMTKYGTIDLRYMPKAEREALHRRNAQVTRRPGTSPCHACGGNNDTTNQRYCRDCVLELHQANGTAPPASLPSIQLEARLKRYGLSTSRYQYLLTRQENACAICKRPQAGSDALLVDHNHETGQVRGLLCGPCNTALGLFQDSPDVIDAALQYLEERGCYGPNVLAEEDQ